MMNAITRLFGVFFQIGLLSIGGGYAIIPLISERVVGRLGWVTQNVYTDIITISQMTPGPLAVNTSTFVGLQVAGVPGAAAATLGCVLPGICIAVFLHRFFQRHRASHYVLEVLGGLKAASLGLIGSAALTLLLLAFTGETELALVSGVDGAAVLLFGAALFFLRKFRVNPIFIMLASGIAGIFLYG